MTSYRYARGDALIALERDRQMSAEGWTPEHDDQHVNEELPRAARDYLLAASLAKYGATRFRSDSGLTDTWPNGWEFKGSPDPIRNLVKAGALIAAEIDRLQRIPAPAEPAAPEHVTESDDDDGGN